MIQAVIFDHDGTLVESEGRHFELWQKILQPFDIAFQAEEYIREHAGIPTLKNAERLVEKYRLALSAEELYAIKEKEVRSSLHGVAFDLLPGVIESMQAFKDADLKMAIATGAGQTEVRSSIQAHGFDRFIEHTATSDEVENGKPAPDVYLLAAKKLGIAPENCIAIEDSNNGLQSAIAAGMPCIVVRNPWSAAPRYDGALAVFNSMTEAQDYILRA